MEAGRDLIYKVTHGLTGPWVFAIIVAIVLGFVMVIGLLSPSSNDAAVDLANTTDNPVNPAPQETTVQEVIPESVDSVQDNIFMTKSEDNRQAATPDNQHELLVGNVGVSKVILSEEFSEPQSIQINVRDVGTIPQSVMELVDDHMQDNRIERIGVIEVTLLNSDISSDLESTIVFSVSNETIEKKNVTKVGIKLIRHNQDTDNIELLRTEYKWDQDDRFYYNAYTPGFSVFVIGLAWSISTGLAGFWRGLPFWIIIIIVLCLLIYDSLKSFNKN